MPQERNCGQSYTKHVYKPCTLIWPYKAQQLISQLTRLATGLTSSDNDSGDRCVGIETGLDDLGPTEQGVPFVPVRAVGGGVLGEGRLGHRNTLTYMYNTCVHMYIKPRIRCTCTLY